MSVDLQVLLDPTRMPAPAAWGAAARAAGFDVELDTDFDPAEFSGFLPCKYKGADAGFEIYFGTLSDAEMRNLPAAAGARAYYVTFSTRSDFREFATSMICAAVLASMADGVLFDADGSTIVPQGTELDWARECEAGIQGDIAQQDAEPPRAPSAGASAVPGAPVPAARGAKPWWKLW